nr:hypothetical protein [Tanacetum cinerariifolium]
MGLPKGLNPLQILLWMIRRMHPNRGIIAEIDADEDVILEEVNVEKNAEVDEKDAVVQGRLEESQAQVYHTDLGHADKVLSMQDDKPEPVKLKEVIEVVTTAKLMTEVVTAATTTITVAPSATRRRKGVVIRDPKETATPSTIIHSELKSKDKRKGIMVQEPKPLKKQAQIEQDKTSKKQKLDEKVEELKKHLQIVPNDEDDVYTEATSLALKPDVEAHIWKNQRGVHGLAKVKSWKLLDSCGVHIITFITTQMILLVERRYPLTRFTLDQMLDNVRLEVKEESELSLELMRLIRRQQQEGYRLEYRVKSLDTSSTMIKLVKQEET